MSRSFYPLVLISSFKYQTDPMEMSFLSVPLSSQWSQTLQRPCWRGRWKVIQRGWSSPGGFPPPGRRMMRFPWCFTSDTGHRAPCTGPRWESQKVPSQGWSDIKLSFNLCPLLSDLLGGEYSCGVRRAGGPPAPGADPSPRWGGRREPVERLEPPAPHPALGRSERQVKMTDRVNTCWFERDQMERRIHRESNQICVCVCVCVFVCLFVLQPTPPWLTPPRSQRTRSQRSPWPRLQKHTVRFLLLLQMIVVDCDFYSGETLELMSC